MDVPFTPNQAREFAQPTLLIFIRYLPVQQ